MINISKAQECSRWFIYYIFFLSHSFRTQGYQLQLDAENFQTNINTFFTWYVIKWVAFAIVEMAISLDDFTRGLDTFIKDLAVNYS